MNAIEIIEIIKNAGAENNQQILESLQDGALLASLGISDQAEVEEAYYMVV